MPRQQALSFQAVYRIDGDGALTLLADDFAQPNGLCFSLDESRLFINDTERGHIRVFRVETNGATILIYPYLVGNPSWSGGWEGPAEGATHVLLTHGHNAHVSGAIEVLKKSGAMLVANFEICMYLVGQG
ncbi:hypothetical protein EN824_33575, partial [Mesorhizobium sp. M8A.F.Ca.ET.181.01.1.1]